MSSTNNPIKSNGLRALFTYNGFGSIPEYQAHSKSSVRVYGPDDRSEEHTSELQSH